MAAPASTETAKVDGLRTRAPWVAARLNAGSVPASLRPGEGSTNGLSVSAFAWHSRLRRLLSNQTLQRQAKRAGGLVILAPSGAFADQLRCRADGVAVGIEADADLRPQERHRHQRSGAGAGRERRHRGRHPVVAQIVEEDAAGALLLRHVEDVAFGTVLGRPPAHLMGKALGAWPIDA